MATLFSAKPQVALAPLTTLRVGGAAKYVVDVTSEEGVRHAHTLATREGVPLFVLGGGSNVLVPDKGVEGVIVRVRQKAVSVHDEDSTMRIVAGAGARWEDVVGAATREGVFGIENLSGIPGTVGGAVVQNIGAYGAELARVFAYAEVFDLRTGNVRRIDPRQAAFGYRTSMFKTHRELVVLRVALQLDKHAEPDMRYADLARAREEGVPLTTPSEIASAIRAIRAKKFPDMRVEGTAGSFFINPTVSRARADALALRFPGLPSYPQQEGAVKLSLAWLLDHALSLKGYTRGPVRLYEKQPLVLVARDGATATDIEAFAEYIRTRVHEATGIAIEREVEIFGTRTA